MILSDGAIGQMMEKVELPAEGSLPHETPSWATVGKPKERERNIITSLFIEPEVMEQVNLKLQGKYKQICDNEKRWEEIQTDDAEIVLVAFGLSARISQKAVDLAREKGIKAGLFRPITLYPYPYERLNKLADKADNFLVVEMNAGQMLEDVKLGVNGKKPVHFKGRMGGMIMNPEDIALEIERLVKKTVLQD
jgi:2-oxoglutarate ferredoxin oxidoreductase subunit alpha